jgi:chromosome segregation ATPase
MQTREDELYLTQSQLAQLAEECEKLKRELNQEREDNKKLEADSQLFLVRGNDLEEKILELQAQLRAAEVDKAGLLLRLKAADAYLEFLDEMDEDVCNWTGEDKEDGGRLWEAYLEAKERGAGA